MSSSVTFDHLAIGVSEWSDAYPRFAIQLGGRWAYGGESGDFATFHLSYRRDRRLEFIAPNAPRGFMRRFIDVQGPGAHHLTFKVPSLTETLAELAELGIETLGGRSDLPFWKEAFLHPKHCGVGTLVQVVQTDEEYMAAEVARSSPPADFPARRAAQHQLAWIGISAQSLSDAEKLFVDVLRADVIDRAEGWMLLQWSNSTPLLLRCDSAVPGGPPLWDEVPEPGVAHLVFGPDSLRPSDLDGNLAQAWRLLHQPTTGLPVWLVTQGA